jgi:DNA-binding GntR family transcriptional regulator
MGMVHAPLLGQAVADSLADMIVKGQLAPGEKLHEKAICEMLGVSRSPLRDGLRALEAQGLLGIEPRGGAVVATLEREEALDLFDCRRFVQPEMVRRATPHLGPKDFERLEQILITMTNTSANGALFDYLMHVQQFLEIVEEACPNRVLVDIVSRLWRRSMRFRAIGVREPRQISRSLTDHRELLDALREGDANTAGAVSLRMITASEQAALAALSNAQDRKTPRAARFRGEP